MIITCSDLLLKDQFEIPSMKLYFQHFDVKAEVWCNFNSQIHLIFRYLSAVLTVCYKRDLLWRFKLIDSLCFTVGWRHSWRKKLLIIMSNLTKTTELRWILRWYGWNQSLLENSTWKKCARTIKYHSETVKIYIPQKVRKTDLDELFWLVNL